MRTLKDHLILYDAECPMCNLYTGAFIKSKMLDNDGRAAYQKAYSTCSQIDLQRAVNEIALVNRQTGEVTYGINSLFAIISNAFPLFKPLFGNRFFAGAMRRLYAFISYNRRVIIPAGETEHSFAVQPSFHKKYRIAYLLVTCLFTSFIFSCFERTRGWYAYSNSFSEELMTIGGLLLFQAIVVVTIRKELLWSYLGNMMTVSVAGALLLLPALLLETVGWFSADTCWFFSLVVTAFMLWEHMRRVKLLGLGLTITATWIAFSIILYLLIS